MMPFERNLLLHADSYKHTHWRQYPPGTTGVYSYLESRGGTFSEIVFFGLQYYLKQYLKGRAFDALDVVEAEQTAAAHFGNPTLFNTAGWRTLLNRHGGYLPVRIKALPEGTVVAPGTALLTIENTDPDFPWLTGFLETMLLKVWYPTTVASQSRAMAKVIKGYLERTGNPELLPFKLHDFGARGVSAEEAAAIGGAAHLTIFRGTDTLAALPFLARYYGATKAAGFSVPATEHSTITSWGGPDREVVAFDHILTQYPTGIVACVSDSYDIFRACSEHWGTTLKAKVEARDGVLVVRPDSGDPLEVVPRVLELLGEKFGFTVNDKGYKVLTPKVRVIQGDGVNLESIGDILSALERKVWSADNLAFGCGGALLQRLDRDTCRMAIKCSAVQVDGEWRDVKKDPVTDPGKRSKAGRLAVRFNHGLGRLETVPERGEGAGHDQLQVVFEDGVVFQHDNTIDRIRERAAP